MSLAPFPQGDVMPTINFLPVLVTAVVLFMLGGLWYSPVLFAKKWVALQGRTLEEMQASGSSPIKYLEVFICGLLTSSVMAMVIAHMPEPNAAHGVIAGVLLWLGFAAATSYGTVLFSMKPKALWAIDSGYNLVSFILAGLILSVWR
jgi:hypothetical protein